MVPPVQGYGFPAASWGHDVGPQTRRSRPGGRLLRSGCLEQWVRWSAEGVAGALLVVVRGFGVEGDGETEEPDGSVGDAYSGDALVDPAMLGLREEALCSRRLMAEEQVDLIRLW